MQNNIITITGYLNDFIDQNYAKFFQEIKKHSDKKIHLILPYPAFSREDDTNKYIFSMAQKFPHMLKEAGVEFVSLVDIHSKSAAQFYLDIFGEKVTFYSANKLFTDELKSIIAKPTPISIGAPDGMNKKEDLAIKRADNLTNYLTPHFNINQFYIHKQRSNTQSEIVNFQGDITSRTCILIDDIIDTGTSMINAVNKLKEQGAKNIICCATHGVLVANSLEKLLQQKLVAQVILTDTIKSKKILNAEKYKKLTILPIKNLIDEIEKDFQQKN